MSLLEYSRHGEGKGTSSDATISLIFTYNYRSWISAYVLRLEPLRGGELGGVENFRFYSQNVM
jgi:hypothetical protein